MSIMVSLKFFIFWKIKIYRYGFDYECIELTSDNICYIEHVTFRGCNCINIIIKQKKQKLNNYLYLINNKVQMLLVCQYNIIKCNNYKLKLLEIQHMMQIINNFTLIINPQAMDIIIKFGINFKHYIY